jgi:hypothetical protein
MRFEARELTPYAESISTSDLEEAATYFSIHYVDDEMLIPTMETLVFIGRDREEGDSGQVYFQDIHSYRRGIRYETASEADQAQFSTGSENEMGHLFEYERALDELLRCSLKRRKAAERRKRK